MAGSDICNVCDKKVLRHSYKLQCSLCDHFVHLKCLPFVTKTDDICKTHKHNKWYCTKCISDVLPFNHMFTDEEFMLAISENLSSSEKIPFDELNKNDTLFTPFDLNDDTNSPLSDSDPDLQLYNQQCNMVLNSCDYYIEDLLNSKLDKLNVTNHSFSLLHTNIRSAPKNLFKLESYLSNIKHSFSILGISESWLREDDKSYYNLDNYKSEHKCRPFRGGGGVSLFIKDSIEYTVREDICVHNKSIESLFIEIKKDVVSKSQDVIVGIIYRPPDTDITAFNEYLHSILLKTKAEKKLLYLLGDYNINLLNADTHNATQDFTELMYSYSLLPNITKPTRVTKTSATLIDNIFSNNLLTSQSILTGILHTDISDHYPIFHIDYSSNIKHDDAVIKKRILSQTNLDNFSSALRNHNWDLLLSLDDAQAAYSCFMQDYICIYDTSFPIKTFKKGYKTRKPWLSEKLKNGIKVKKSFILQTEKNRWILNMRLYINVSETN